MNVFEEGNQYGLSTKGECNNSLIFVKLTDSAMQSIELYLNSKADSSLKPTIHFQENSGTISLPINGEKQNYRFTLSNIEKDGLQSSFQCLQHSHKWSLRSLGIMLKRMHIHANEDSYEKTKFKMEAVDKEQKSFCTKEIKSNGTFFGRKFKVKRPGLVSSFDKFHLAAKKPQRPNFNLKNKLVSSANIFQQPIRKRIIHILAIKPYKKPELLLRLIREGVIDKDKKDFNTVLTSVSTLKGNIYNLANHLWNEVQENWEFCTKEELQLIQRRKQQFLKSCENEITNSMTQNNSSPFQKIISSEPITEMEPLIKKRRMSHNCPRITDQIVKDNSPECDNSNKNRFAAVNDHQKLPDVHLRMNGNYNGSYEKNKDPVISVGKEFLSSQKLKNLDDQINRDNHTSDSSHNMSSKKQSISDSNFKTDVSKHINSKSVEEEAIMSNKHFNNLHHRTFSFSLENTDNRSKVHVKKLADSQSEDKDSRRYKCSNTNSLVNNKTSHANGVSMINRSEIISPISYSDSSDSSLSNKDKYDVFNK